MSPRPKAPAATLEDVTCEKCGTAHQIQRPEGHLTSILWECTPCGAKNTADGVVVGADRDHVVGDGGSGSDR